MTEQIITKTIKSGKIARVEGTGSIEVEIEKNIVKNVKVNILEGPRLVEELIKGKNVEEVISIVPRICAICNLSHRLATVTAMKNATTIKPNKATMLFQRLLHMGEMIESHTLHVYLLVLPDLLNQPSAVHLVESHGKTVIEGLTQKKFGNKIMRLAGGDRMIHGENPRPGGFGKFPSINQLRELIEESQQLLPHAISITKTLASFNVDNFAETDTNYVCVDPPNNEFGFYGDHIISSTGTRVPSENYDEIFTERVVPHSYAKRALHEGKPFTVGSLARIVNIGDRLKGSARKLYDEFYNDSWKANPLYNNLAQAIENVYSMEMVPVYAQKLIDLLENDADISIIEPNQQSGRGVGSVEAPRGLLIHDYTLENGLLTKGNIVTPTAQNLDDIEKHLWIGAENLLAREVEDDQIRFNLEVLTRSYDPCISCSAHMVKIKRV